MAIEEFPSVLGPPVELTPERCAHIVSRHPVVAPFLDRVRDVLARPDQIRRSGYAPDVFLFSRFFPDVLGGKHLVVVVRTDGRWFVLTVYLTRRLAGGERYEGADPILV